MTLFYCPECGRQMKLNRPRLQEILIGARQPAFVCAECECGKTIEGLFIADDDGTGAIFDQKTEKIILKGKSVPDKNEGTDERVINCMNEEDAKRLSKRFGAPLERTDPHAGYDTLRADFERMKLQRDEARKQCEELACKRETAIADLAQMKSTLSDTQQKLRAVQEDRDEFAAKMNDAVERAERLESELPELNQDRTNLSNDNRFLAGEVEAFRFVVRHWRGGGT